MHKHCQKQLQKSPLSSSCLAVLKEFLNFRVCENRWDNEGWERQAKDDKYIKMHPNKCMTAFKLFSMGEKSSFTNSHKYLWRAWILLRHKRERGRSELEVGFKESSARMGRLGRGWGLFPESIRKKIKYLYFQ